MKHRFWNVNKTMSKLIPFKKKYILMCSEYVRYVNLLLLFHLCLKSTHQSHEEHCGGAEKKDLANMPREREA